MHMRTCTWHYMTWTWTWMGGRHAGAASSHLLTPLPHLPSPPISPDLLRSPPTPLHLPAPPRVPGAAHPHAPHRGGARPRQHGGHARPLRLCARALRLCGGVPQAHAGRLL
eukprot:scaffold35915_cov69-Phaeocystis_antarctica.AAC.8